MTGKKIKIIFTLLIICLLSIFIFQAKWIENAYKIKQEQFDRSVNEAMNFIAMKMQGNEINNYVDKHYNNINSNIIEINNVNDINKIIKEEKSSIENENDEKELIERKFNQVLWNYYSRELNLTQRINIKELDSLVNEELKLFHIELKYEFAILEFDKFPPYVKPFNNKLKSKGFSDLMKDKCYSTVLYPRDIMGQPGKLLIYFPNKNDFIFKSISLMLLGSFLFSLIIVLTFIYTIYYIYKQKRLSDIKTDFINNMTHEFKTPIATISLASDSILNKKVINDEIQIKDFIKIIKEENKRMNSHVEQVLQIALLDKKDFNLKLELIDLHELICFAADKIKLQVKSREGKINKELNAINNYINGDRIHLLNVFLNIFDNAIKYNEGKPIIKIKTLNKKNEIIIYIEDNGIGMTKEQTTKIFDKFYRVSKGNIHNTKGFGLGLSYVKAIIIAHNGNVCVNSELGKGSVFELSIPISGKNI